ncbi:MAG: histidinol dehydrogenase, partial [Halanaerobiales bacterium]
MKKLKYPENRAEIEEILAGRTFDSRKQEYEAAFDIVSAVKNEGDGAVYRYTERFDGVKLAELKVTEAEFAEAYERVDDDFLVSLRAACENIWDFHHRQLRDNWFSSEGDKMVGQLFNPLARVGVYIPGGRAPYPSSVLMTVLPAAVASVDEIVGTTPPGEDGKVNPHILVAAAEAGVDEL